MVCFHLLIDFSKLDMSNLKRNFGLKQVVNFATRGQNTLTYLHDYYNAAVRHPPFCLAADHMSIKLNAKRPLKLPKQRTL